MSDYDVVKWYLEQAAERSDFREINSYLFHLTLHVFYYILIDVPGYIRDPLSDIVIIHCAREHDEEKHRYVNFIMTALSSKMKRVIDEGGDWVHPDETLDSLKHKFNCITNGEAFPDCTI